jgi:hypothetical protein
MPARFVFARQLLHLAHSTPVEPTYRIQFVHMTSDTSQSLWPAPDVEPKFVVRCNRRSNSLSNSTVNATSAQESSVDSGRRSLERGLLILHSGPPVSGMRLLFSRCCKWRFCRGEERRSMRAVV